MSSHRVPAGSVLIRDYWSGQLVTGIAAGWFLISGWAIFGALFVGYDSPGGSYLPGSRVFINLSELSVFAAVLAWLRFRYVYRTFTTGLKTTGVLADVSRNRSGSAKLKFKYAHDNKTCQVANIILGGHLRETGETVEVVYDPANPSRAYVWDTYVPGEASSTRSAE